MLREKVRVSGKSPLTDDEKNWIKTNYQSVTVITLAKHLKRANTTVYEYMRSESLTPYVPQRNNHGHPWRKANHQLENYVIARKKSTV